MELGKNARRLSGMRTCFPLKMMPSSTANSSRNDQKTRTSVGRSLMLSGHPWMMVSMSAFMVGSLAVWSRSWYCFLCEKLTRSMSQRWTSAVVISIPSTLRSNSTAPLSFGFGSLDRVSARVVVFPCRYSMVKTYPCIFWSILWSLGGALGRGFLAIISSGLWSVITRKGRPYRYVWKRLMPNTTASISRSMFG